MAWMERADIKYENKIKEYVLLLFKIIKGPLWDLLLTFIHSFDNVELLHLVILMSIGLGTHEKEKEEDQNN